MKSIRVDENVRNQTHKYIQLLIYFHNFNTLRNIM